MNIAIVSQNASPGILIFRHDLIERLVEGQHSVYAFAIDYTDESKAEVRAMGATPIDYSLSRTGMNPLRDLSDTFSLVGIFKDKNIDLVFSSFVKPSIYATLAARIAGVPRRFAMLEGLGFIHTPGRNGFTFKKRLLQVIQGGLVSISYAFAEKIFFLNPDDPVDLARTAMLDKKKLHVLGPIGLNLANYVYTPIDLSNPVRFIFVGRLLSEKGIFEYLRAADIVKQQYPSTEFVVLGGLDSENPSGLTQAELNEEVDKGTIIYPGYVKNVTDYIASSHVFVLPSSYREGVPRSTQEAMALGRPVITTDVPGCRETVEDGVNGFLVPPWAPEALAEKMIYFIENKSEIERMGWESYRIAQDKFDVNKVNDNLLKLLGLHPPELNVQFHKEVD